MPKTLNKGAKLRPKQTRSTEKLTHFRKAATGKDSVSLSKQACTDGGEEGKVRAQTVQDVRVLGTKTESTTAVAKQ